MSFITISQTGPFRLIYIVDLLINASARLEAMLQFLVLNNAIRMRIIAMVSIYLVQITMASDFRQYLC
jgi:hypothetical protein